MVKLEQILLYFGRFVGPNILLDGSVGNDNIEGYNGLIEAIKEVSTDRVIPSIQHFVMGVDEKFVVQRISTFSSRYMFVDYGEIGIEGANDGLQKKSIDIAVTIADPLPSGTYTHLEALALADQTLAIVEQLHLAIKADSKNMAMLRYYNNPSFMPFDAPTLASSKGWTLSFRLDYY